MIDRTSLRVCQQPIEVFRSKTRRVAEEGDLANMLNWPALKPAVLITLLGGPPKGKTPPRRRALEFGTDISRSRMIGGVTLRQPEPERGIDRIVGCFIRPAMLEEPHRGRGDPAQVAFFPRVRNMTDIGGFG